MCDQLGYRVELLRGEGPDVYTEPMAFIDVSWVTAEPLDVQLRVRAVDAAGNDSDPIDVRAAASRRPPTRY